ncbi:MAG: hypothetical protein ACR2PZ_26610 [Pseudomonadales bacterium]
MRVFWYSLIATAAFCCLPAQAAENRILYIWTCELNEGKTSDDVQKANSVWIKFVNKQVPKGGIRSFVVSPIVGDATKFRYLDSYPDLTAWTAMDKAMKSDRGQEIEASLNEAATCSHSSLHNAVETE